ncbi:MAG: hypothetical protein BWX44_00884 [Spirochaetes bacterium ADurb.Bin001]|nr:MAG: hypothetical protein BWX44_00884 [Spirochaetes bacterium ADurb.Bin001]
MITRTIAGKATRPDSTSRSFRFSRKDARYNTITGFQISEG